LVDSQARRLQPAGPARPTAVPQLGGMDRLDSSQHPFQRNFHPGFIV